MRCLCCRRRLVQGEMTVCEDCQSEMAFVESVSDQNVLYRKMCGMMDFEHATTLSLYEPDSRIGLLLHKAKFRFHPGINVSLTELLLERLAGSGWPYDIDVILPIPIHWRRLVRRGYNQVSPIARTLSKHWHIPVEWDCLRRGNYLNSQVSADLDSRLKKQKTSLVLKHPERLIGRHILLVDDVCTTGATLLASADLLHELPGVRVSILTLAITLQV